MTTTVAQVVAPPPPPVLPAADASFAPVGAALGVLALIATGVGAFITSAVSSSSSNNRRR